jgi:hypothetical protein
MRANQFLAAVAALSIPAACLANLPAGQPPPSGPAPLQADQHGFAVAPIGAALARADPSTALADAPVRGIAAGLNVPAKPKSSPGQAHATLSTGAGSLPGRQGGDTGETAVVIDALPFTDTGTTVGYTDDYTPECAGESSAPDVVYSFAPPADMYIDISLCDGTNFDTVLYVILDDCASGPQVACVDDACGFQSLLRHLTVTGGHTYYIIVDGYLDYSGDYTITVTESGPPPPPPACPADSLYAQAPYLPEDPWGAVPSGNTPWFSTTIYDNFASLGSRITGVRWFGFCANFNPDWYPFWFPCDVAELSTFEVRFYHDVDGQLGAEADSYTVTATSADTGYRYAGFELYEFSAELAPGCALANGWISIYSLPTPGNCTLLWMQGPPQGDGDSLEWDGRVYLHLANDMSLCLTGDAEPVYGACCDDQEYSCDEREMTLCLPWRFTADTLCADLDPPCGEVTGACCRSDASCDVTTQADCFESWLGPFATCMLCPCITPCPPDGVPEGEPDCYDGYVDVTNGGCDWRPDVVFEPLAPGQVVCATSGTYISSEGEHFRDTDWYEYATREDQHLSVTVEAEFPVELMVMRPGYPDPCSNREWLGEAAAGQPCLPITVDVGCVPPGVYWIATFSDDTTIPCGSRYTLRLDAESCHIPRGACCPGSGECIPDLSEADCTSYPGFWMGDAVPCDLSPCAACTPDFVVDAPGTWFGDTCGAGNDCPWHDSEDQIFEVNISTAGTWVFQNCGLADWSTRLYLSASCCGDPIALNVGGCISGDQARIEADLEPGTYWVTQEAPYSGCGPYGLNISLAEECGACPEGATPDQERECYDGYIDVTNGGCWSDPPVFQPITCGETVCGTGGTYWMNGDRQADTDWYEITTRQWAQFTWSVEAEFPVEVGLAEQTVLGVPGCDNTTGALNPMGHDVRCVPVSVTTDCLPPGTYYFVVGPATDDVPCGRPYFATLTCVSCEQPPPPENDECENALCLWDGASVSTNNRWATGADVSSCGDLDAADMWWSYTPLFNGEITLDTYGSDFNTTLAVYDGCGGPELTCNDNAMFMAFWSRVTFSGTAGDHYLVRVAGANGQTGNIVLNASGGQAACPGDMNCDGTIDGYDVDPFVLALVNPTAYAAQLPYCSATLADINGDGSINGYDIDPFVALLTGSK